MITNEDLIEKSVRKMERTLVPRPEGLGELPDMFIYYASRNDSLFQNRSMKIFDWSEGIDSLFAEIPIPNNLILCDSCNTKIEGEKFPLLIQLTEDPEVQFVREALCQNCVDKYYHNFICVGNPDTQSEEMKRNGI